MTSTTIQPCSIDARIPSSAPTTNYGSGSLVVGKYSTTSTSRTLVKFDHSTIPAEEECNSATLSLWLLTDYATVNVTWSVYRLLRDWTEAGVTWNKYDGTNSWETAGGLGSADVAATPLGTSSTIANDTAVDTEIQISLDATEFQKMYDGTYTNYGFLIKATTESDNGQWEAYNREHATTGYRPKLVVVSGTTPVATPSNLLLLGVG